MSIHLRRSRWSFVRDASYAGPLVLPKSNMVNGLIPSRLSSCLFLSLAGGKLQKQKTEEYGAM